MGASHHLSNNTHLFHVQPLLFFPLKPGRLERSKTEEEEHEAAVEDELTEITVKKKTEAKSAEPKSSVVVTVSTAPEATKKQADTRNEKASMTGELDPDSKSLGFVGSLWKSQTFPCTNEVFSMSHFVAVLILPPTLFSIFKFLSGAQRMSGLGWPLLKRPLTHTVQPSKQRCDIYNTTPQFYDACLLFFFFLFLH